MANAEITKILPVSKASLFRAITEYENYPKFVEGCTKTKVDRTQSGECTVEYHLTMMKEIQYTLIHRENAEAGTIEWTLGKSDFFKKNSGKWTLVEKGPNSTEATYSLDVEFSIPVPGFILSRLVKGNLPGMMKSFEKRAQDITGK